MRASDHSQTEGGESRPVLIIAGPTASGKSSMAIDVAAHFSGTVINADSQQVYRELRILSARPSPDDEARVPHRLYGILAGDEACSAGRWAQLARAEIEAAWDTDRLPILVGGTGMYVKAMTEGLSPIPDIPDGVRAQARKRFEALGPASFHAEVAALDPDTAQRLPQGDTQRLLRAWEVTIHTGRPLSAWQAEPRVKPVPGARFAVIKILPPRDALYAGIDARFAKMVKEGALGEVQALLDAHLPARLPVMKALGVAELASYLKGETDLETAVAKAATLSRNYAKRQLTWLRHQLDADLVLDAQYSESFAPKIFSFVQHFLLTEGA